MQLRSLSLCCLLLYVADQEISEGLKISVKEIGTYLKFAAFQIDELNHVKVFY